MQSSTLVHKLVKRIKNTYMHKMFKKAFKFMFIIQQPFTKLHFMGSREFLTILIQPSEIQIFITILKILNWCTTLLTAYTLDLWPLRVSGVSFWNWNQEKSRGINMLSYWFLRNIKLCISCKYIANNSVNKLFPSCLRTSLYLSQWWCSDSHWTRKPQQLTAIKESYYFRIPGEISLKLLCLQTLFHASISID